MDVGVLLSGIIQVATVIGAFVTAWVLYRKFPWENNLTAAKTQREYTETISQMQKEMQEMHNTLISTIEEVAIERERRREQIEELRAEMSRMRIQYIRTIKSLVRQLVEAGRTPVIEDERIREEVEV